MQRHLRLLSRKGPDDLCSMPSCAATVTMVLRLATTLQGTLTNLGVEALSLTFCSYGVTGTEVSGEATGAACAAPSGAAKPFLTNPTECTGPAPVDDAGGRHLPAAG